MSEPLTHLLDNIFIRFGTKLYGLIVGFPMGTNCALIADLYLFCYERDFMAPLLFLIIKKLKLFKQLTLHLDI